MTDLSDREYFASRALDARARAEASTDAPIAAVHIELAQAYEKLMKMVPDKKRNRLTLVETDSGQSGR